VHEVLRVLGERARAGSLPGERRDGFRVALAIEGGGMRGTISAGMALRAAFLGRDARLAAAITPPVS